MVDIHSHILPSLDDGSRSLEESLRMARQAVSTGIRHMAATSHGNFYDYTLEDYWTVFRKTQEAFTTEQIPLKLYPGMEIFLDEDAFFLLEKKELLSLNSTDYLLVEFDFEELPEKVADRIGRLKKNGWRVVLAHPERYRFIQREPDLAYDLADRGCLLQVNGGSLLGDFGRTCERMALRFLEDGIVGAIASDTHDAEYRTPSAERVCRFLESFYEPAAVKLWMSENPSRILKGMPTLDLRKL